MNTQNTHEFMCVSTNISIHTYTCVADVPIYSHTHCCLYFHEHAHRHKYIQWHKVSSAISQPGKQLGFSPPISFVPSSPRPAESLSRHSKALIIIPV